MNHTPLVRMTFPCVVASLYQHRVIFKGAGGRLSFKCGLDIVLSSSCIVPIQARVATMIPWPSPGG